MKRKLYMALLFASFALSFYAMFLRRSDVGYSIEQRVWTENLDETIFINSRLLTLGENSIQLKRRLVASMFKAYLIDRENFSRVVKRIDLVDLGSEIIRDPLDLEKLYKECGTETFDNGVEFVWQNKIIVAIVVCNAKEKEILATLRGYESVVKDFGVLLKSEGGSELGGASKY